MREKRSKNSALIEERLRNYTVNANMNTTKNKPRPADCELNFRSYVDHTVDIMSRCSIGKLK